MGWGGGWGVDFSMHLKLCEEGGCDFILSQLRVSFVHFHSAGDVE